MDIHSYDLVGAIIEVAYAIDECKALSDTQLTLIHGYNRGQTLKNYFQSKAFLEDMHKDGYSIQIINSTNPGRTLIKIN